MSKPVYAIATLNKRLLALTYDIFLVFAICMAVAALYTSSAHALIGDRPIPGWLLQLTLLPCLILTIGSFYTYCWRTTGQTLGMQTWRIKVFNVSSAFPRDPAEKNNCPDKISVKQCWLRFAGAWLSFFCLGIGFLILLRPRNMQTWHDRWSNTMVYDVSKQADTMPQQL